MNNLQQFVVDSIMGNGALYQDSQIYPQGVSVVKMLPLPEGSLKMVQKFNTALTLHCIHDLQSVSQAYLKFKKQPFQFQDSKYIYKYIFWIKTIFFSKVVSLGGGGFFSSLYICTFLLFCFTQTYFMTVRFLNIQSQKIYTQPTPHSELSNISTWSVSDTKCF